MSETFKTERFVYSTPPDPSDRKSILAQFSSRSLNLGCGWDIRPDYINVDGQPAHNPDLIGDIVDLTMLPSLSFEDIVARDVLEHFHWRDTPRALFEWNRLLVSGGKLFIRTTYLNGLLRKLEEPGFASIPQQKLLIICLFSMQKYQGDYHLTSFTERLMRFYLWMCGFSITQIEVMDGWLFEVTATKSTDYSYAGLVDRIDGELEFVTACYRAILQREPDPIGFHAFHERLASKALTRDELIKTMLLSEEYQNRIEARAPDFDLAFFG